MDDMFPGLDRIDADAERAERDAREEFVVRREPKLERRDDRGTADAVHTLSIRCRITASNAFIRYCKRNRLSYREGFDAVARWADSQP
jgi:hypothetical protein